ncbi:MAG TPA: N,N-dimethylformamidase beta subunit family domain-containing protein, partial [Parafilimonas sp.]|nr:N,N-dimethylformamidase beta subunit family domain-containing protein [Parafilimonas sp.]
MKTFYHRVIGAKPGFALVVFCALFFQSFFTRAQNAIVTENALPGNPSSEWDISGAGDLTMQGFATDISVNKGETVHFKIKSSVAYTIDIYRLGYYQGNGARKVGTGVITATLPQTQPADLYDAATGLTDCGNWVESAHWNVPSDAVSGIYIARLKRANGNASHIVFIVRDDASHSDLFFQTSDATWQAYNAYGGNSLYTGITSLPSGHAAKVSYNRPFITRNGGGGGGASEDWLFNAEYPMLRWLERNGYDVTYTTNVDGARSGDLIKNHKVFLSVGHDEYWSAEQRASVQAARDNGVHLAFFSGNEIYWKTRWEASNDGANTPYRTLVCYKEGTLGENVCGSKCDPLATVWTGLWRDGCSFPSADGCHPENSLSGQISWDGTTSAIQVPDTYKNLRFWRNTSVATLGAGQTATFPAGTLGYEWDWEQYPASYPAGRIRMSKTVSNSHTHQLSLYKASSGALVFGAGTVQWSWGLDDDHDRGSNPPSTAMQQATVNLFADMSVQPATLQSGLVAATASTDVQPPASVITTPSDGASSPAGTPINITGTASDAGGGVVAGVEVSVDGGTTWNAATGTANWSFSFTPNTQGSLTIKTRAVDDIGNLETPGSGVTITIGPAGPTICPCTIWPSGSVPGTEADPDNQPVEVGVKFRANVNGYITGIRYYKSATNTGIHVGSLWGSNGDNLAQATFAGESSTGWQEVSFTSPVAITAGVTYIASYHTNTGHYAEDDFYFSSSGFSSANLSALANGEDGPNGVYVYSASSAFPTQTFNASNYWVDVVFNTSVGPDVTPPSVTSTVPLSNASGVNINTAVEVNFNEALDETTVGSSSIELTDPVNVQVYATVSYGAGTRKVTITPVSPLAYSTTYTVKVKGGNTDPRIKDVAGNALQDNYTWSFTTGAPPPPPPTEGPGGPILLISAASNPFSRYPVEILRAQGFNEFDAMDISQVTQTILDNHDVVILGEIPLSASNVTMLTDWVNAGGTLIALKPDAQLASLMGITKVAGSLTDKYLLVNTASDPGAGIVNQTIQFHGSADLYTLNGATSIATLYSAANTATSNPAVTMKNVGANGGVAIAFTYDLARSVVYTHQGNPAWAGQKRDGEINPIRSDDMFFPDWIDFNKVAIPQADEQQHLLSNLILKGNQHRKPLPRFWFLPKGLKAAVVMTGDDHGSGGTTGRFNQYLSLSSSNTAQAVADWTAVRGTSYIYPNTPISDAQAAAFQAQGFEIALHLNTNCDVWTPSSLDNYLTTQLSQLAAQFPSLSPPATNRTHCISWSDWASKPKAEAAKGIRLDVNYYYWPAAWVQNRAGMFTGSGMPMRFADLDGTVIDCYQVVTQMPDESGEVFPGFIDALLDKAIGPEGYYGVFCANMHTDNASSSGSDAIIASAQSKQIPVVSAKQMLDWLDGRNGSSFGSLVWNGNQLSFTVAVGSGANNLKGMLPVTSSVGQLTGLSLNGSPVLYETQTIKGIQYAFFNAAAGSYVASYAIDNTAPVITDVVATPHSDGTATITWTTDEFSSSRVDYGTAPDALSQNVNNSSLVVTHSMILTGLTPGTTYYFKVTSADAANNSASVSGDPVAFNFTLPAPPCAEDAAVADFNLGSTGTNTMVTNQGVILKPVTNEDFNGTSIPSSFAFETWGTGGTATVNNGVAVIDGSHLSSNASFSPGTFIEFAATFTAGNFQNVGLSTGSGFNEPWVTIGRGGEGDNNLYARASPGGQRDLLGANLLGTQHIYKILWNVNNTFSFYVDGNLISTPGVTITASTPLVIQLSDFDAGGANLTVDWIRVSPYVASGIYTSRIFNQGSSANWGAVTWTASIPSGTSLGIEVRTGNSPSPDLSWTSFTSVANGGNAGANSQYIQYRANLATTNNTATPVLQNINIECDAGTDETPPVITNIEVEPSSDGESAVITWNTDESSDGAIDYGTSEGSLNQHKEDATPTTSHSITITGLIPGATYYYRVTSKDGSANSATEPASPAVPLSFVTPIPPCFTDVTAADFGGGTANNTYITIKDDGEITLQPSRGTEFSTLPPVSEWANFSWTGSGSSTVSDGILSVDGQRFNTEPENATFGPGSTLEFVATFGAATFQHIGFAGGTDAIGSGGIYNGDSPWAMFSTGSSSTVLKARTALNASAATEIDLGNYPGTSHLYRIEWLNDGSFKYYIDGVLVLNQNQADRLITTPMRVAISDFATGGPDIKVDWIHVTPYITSGSFQSRVFNAGSQRNWGNISWTAETPSGETSAVTTVSLFVRTGNTAIPDGSWSAYTEVSNGGAINQQSQYIQYKAELTTSDAAVTPALKDVTVTCSDIVNTIPVVTTDPAGQTVCAGSSVSFTSAATGTPSPTVQWQVSTDNGDTWDDIDGATNSTLSFNTSDADDGKQYRAVW